MRTFLVFIGASIALGATLIAGYLITRQPTFDSAGTVDITLTHPSKPGLTIKVDKVYLPSTFLRLVQKNRKGGEHSMAMLDVSYPRMKPLSSEDVKSDRWHAIVFFANSSDDFVSNYFQSLIGTRYKKVSESSDSLEKYVLSDFADIHPTTAQVWSEVEIYYHGKRRWERARAPDLLPVHEKSEFKVCGLYPVGVGPSGRVPHSLFGTRRLEECAHAFPGIRGIARSPMT